MSLQTPSSMSQALHLFCNYNQHCTCCYYCPLVHRRLLSGEIMRRDHSSLSLHNMGASSSSVGKHSPPVSSSSASGAVSHSATAAAAWGRGDAAAAAAAVAPSPPPAPLKPPNWPLLWVRWRSTKSVHLRNSSSASSCNREPPRT